MTATRDRRSGATVVAAKLWDELMVLEGHEQRLEAAITAVASHPELTPLYGVLNCSILMATSDLSTAGCVAALRHMRSAVNRDTGQAIECAARTFSGTTPTEFCVLSHSGTVDRVFERLAEQNIYCRVLCSESRPLLEGRKTAENMAAMGHRVVLCSDAQIVGMVTKDSMVVLGCDRIGNDRFRNKVGSLALLLAARHHGASTMLISGNDKLVDDRIPWVRPRQETPSELWDGHPDCVQVDNKYFEDVPTSLLDVAVIGDRGVLGSSDLSGVERPRFHDKTVAIVRGILSGESFDMAAYIRDVLRES